MPDLSDPTSDTASIETQQRKISSLNDLPPAKPLEDVKLDRYGFKLKKIEEKYKWWLHTATD